nr:hypothetical protein [Brucella intermedia]
MPLTKHLMITPEMKKAQDLSSTVEAYRFSIQRLIDSKAQEKLYDDGVSLASYINSTVPEWAGQAAAFVAWRDSVWVYAFAELAKVQSGERPEPSIDDFLAELPSFSADVEMI